MCAACPLPLKLSLDFRIPQTLQKCPGSFFFATRITSVAVTITWIRCVVEGHAYPEHLSCPAFEPVFTLEVGRRRVKDAVLDVVGGGAAHGEEGRAIDLEDLPAHQVEHMGSDIADFPALPLMDWEFIEPVEVAD